MQEARIQELGVTNKTSIDFWIATEEVPRNEMRDELDNFRARA